MNELTLRASSGCPSCGARHAVDLVQRLEAKPFGSFSLSGAQTKTVASEVWAYDCTRCGATGKAEPPGRTDLLASLPTGACGHVIATAHFSGDDHRGQDCPGCCPACQATTDAAKGYG